MKRDENHQSFHKSVNKLEIEKKELSDPNEMV